jgi:hypothetical protein
VFVVALQILPLNVFLRAIPNSADGGLQRSQLQTVSFILDIPQTPREGKRMTPLTIFGLVAVTAMLVSYALEKRSRWFILAFAGSCALGSVYGFLQGAWPFGIVEVIWAVVAVRRWRAAASSLN